MQTMDSLPLENIVGRITHGLIGLDLFLNEKEHNDYLGDFLTLKREEIKAALVSLSSKTRLVPTSEVELSDEENGVIQCVLHTQKIVSNLDNVNSEKEIEKCINELGMKLDVLYKAMLRR